VFFARIFPPSLERTILPFAFGVCSFGRPGCLCFGLTILAQSLPWLAGWTDLACSVAAHPAWPIRFAFPFNLACLHLPHPLPCALLRCVLAGAPLPYRKEYKDNKGSAISCLYSIAGRSGGRQAAAVLPHSEDVTCARAKLAGKC
jgi:hypothetical protein